MKRKSSYIIKMEMLKVLAKREYELSEDSDYYIDFDHFQYQLDRLIKYFGFDVDDFNNVRYYGSELNAANEFKKMIKEKV